MEHIVSTNKLLQSRINNSNRIPNNLRLVTRPIQKGDYLHITHSAWDYVKTGMYQIHENNTGLYITCKGVPMYTDSKTFRILFKYHVYEKGGED